MTRDCRHGKTSHESPWLFIASDGEPLFGSGEVPCIERHRAVAAHVVRQRAQPAVEARGHAVEAVVGPREAHLRRGVVGAGQQLDLAGAQQLRSRRRWRTVAMSCSCMPRTPSTLWSSTCG